MNHKLYIPFFALLFFNSIVKAQEPRVGINLEEPTATLDVNGNLKVKHPDDITGKKLPFLYQDDNGQIVTNKYDSEGYMYTMQFDITSEKKTNSKPHYSDLIESYNTRVSGDKYFMFVMGATLMQRDIEGKEFPAFLLDSKENHYPFKEVTLKRIDGKGDWVLEADYPSANPANNEPKDGEIFWRVKALIIKNEYIGYLNADSGDRDKRQPEDPNEPYQALEFPTNGTEFPLDFEIEEAIKLESHTNKAGVGINTPDPKLELDVNGNVVVREINEASQTDLIPLFLGNKKNEEGRLGVSTGGKPFSIISGKVNCKGITNRKINDKNLPIWADWIYSFDTKIPGKTHTLMLADAYLDNDYYERNKNNNDPKGYDTRIYGIARVPNPKDKSETMNAQEVINLYKEAGANGEETWRISADYPANPVCGRLDYLSYGYKLTEVEKCSDKYSWKFRLLAISNAFITDLGVFRDEVTDHKDSDDSKEDGIKNYPYDKDKGVFVPRGMDLVEYMLNRK